MKALVTGGAGFLGSHLVERLLAEGHEVRVFDHRLAGKGLSREMLRRVEAIESDITNAAAVDTSAANCDAIFHCAAVVGVDAYTTRPVRTMEVEEAGLRNVCAAAIARDVKHVIYASSSAVYGQAGGDKPLSEDIQVAPVSNYGIAKRFNELYLDAQFAEHGLKSASVRIFNIYGPGQDERLVIPRFVRQSLENQPIVIYGDGQQTRDFVYVDDVVDVALSCVERIEGCEVVNACSGRETTVKVLAEKIVTLTGSQSLVSLREPPAGRNAFEVARCFGSRVHANELLGSRPSTELDEGLRRTISAILAKAVKH